MSGGYDKEKLRVDVDVRLRWGAEELEVDLLCEDPFLVGEVKTYLGGEEVDGEVEKLLEKKKRLEEIYGKRVEYLVFAVGNTDKSVAEKLRGIADRENILLFVGRVSG